jgi:hypothetical protein
MKDFVVKDFGKFLEISDTIESPFKFYEIASRYEGEKEVITVRASVWMRTALLSFEQNFDSMEKAKKECISELTKHNFAPCEIRETPVVIK